MFPYFETHPNRCRSPVIRLSDPADLTGKPTKQKGILQVPLNNWVPQIGQFIGAWGHLSASICMSTILHGPLHYFHEVVRYLDTTISHDRKQAMCLNI